MIDTPHYTLNQIIAKFPIIPSKWTLRRYLREHNVKEWKPTFVEKKGLFHNVIFYDKNDIDKLVKPVSPRLIFNEQPVKKVSDVPINVYSVGESVTFYEGSFKWKGTVQDITKDGYVVNSDGIGRVTKKWFELGK